MKKFLLGLLIMSSATSLTAATCPAKDAQVMRDKLLTYTSPKNESVSYYIYQSLERRKITTFASDNLLTDGIEESAFNDWQDYTSCLAPYTKQEVYKTAEFNKFEQPAATYKNWQPQLEKIAADLYTTVNKLKGASNTAELKTALDTISKLSDETSKMAVYALRRIASNTPVNQEWLKKWQKDIEKKKASQIWKNYEQQLKNFKKNVIVNMARNEINQQAFEKFLTDNKVTNERSAASLVDQLEALMFRLKLVIKKAWTGSKERKEQLELAQKLMEHIINKYPTLTSKKFIFGQIAYSNDLASMIILGQAEALNGTLTKLKKEISAKLGSR